MPLQISQLAPVPVCLQTHEHTTVKNVEVIYSLLSSVSVLITITHRFSYEASGRKVREPKKTKPPVSAGQTPISSKSQQVSALTSANLQQLLDVFQLQRT